MRKGIKIPGTLKAFLPSLFSPGAFQLPLLQGARKGLSAVAWQGTPSPIPDPTCQPRSSSHPHTQAALTLYLFFFLQCHISPLAPQPLSAPSGSHKTFQPIFLAAVSSLPSTSYTVAPIHHSKIPFIVPCGGNI